MVVFVWYGFFLLLMVMQSSVEGVIFFCFLVGIGFGIELVIIDIYFSEWVLIYLCNKVFVFVFFIQFFLVLVVVLMFWMLVLIILFGFSGWCWVIIFGVLFLLVIWFICKKLLELVCWLESKGWYDDVYMVMCEMEVCCGLMLLLKYVYVVQSVVKCGIFCEIWVLEYWQCILMLMVMNFFQVIGFFGFGNWLLVLFFGQGVSIIYSLLYVFFIIFVYLLGCLFCICFVYCFENKWQIVFFVLMIVIFGILFVL